MDRVAPLDPVCQVSPETKQNEEQLVLSWAEIAADEHAMEPVAHKPPPKSPVLICHGKDNSRFILGS